MGTAIVIGVGPDQGLGAQLCKRFAAEGLNVLVAGRTKAALDAVVADIVAAGGRAVSVVADATSEADIVALFDQAGSDLELAIYNAGNNTPARSSIWRPAISSRAGASYALAAFCSGAKPSAAWFRKARARCCSRVRARRSGDVRATARSIRPRRASHVGAGDGKGIRKRRYPCRPCGGRWCDRRRKDKKRFPDAASREDRLISIDGIVDGFVFLHKQPRRAWSFELDVRTSHENW